MPIKPATKEDAPFLLRKIKELAAFENAADKVTLTLEQFIKDGFGPTPLFKAVVLNSGNADAGFALYYNRYSTWKGKALYLEDLYISPEFRNKGLGKELMNFLIKEANETGCSRFEWQVLNWNTPAIEMYKKLGAEIDDEWLNCRLKEEQLRP